MHIMEPKKHPTELQPELAHSLDDATEAPASDSTPVGDDVDGDYRTLADARRNSRPLFARGPRDRGGR